MLRSLLSILSSSSSPSISPADQKLIDELKKMSLKDKLEAGKKNEDYALCLLTHFQNELGGYNKQALDMHESDQYYARNDTKLVSGAYFLELATTHQSAKNAILASQTLRAKLAPSALEELEKTSILSITGKK